MKRIDPAKAEAAIFDVALEQVAHVAQLLVGNPRLVDSLPSTPSPQERFRSSLEQIPTIGGLSVSGLLNLILWLPRYAGIALIRLYRLFLSPFMGRQCRYLPTCSEYTEEAIRRYGLWAGAWMGLARFQRCGPFGASGFDPVPDRLDRGAAWYLPWRYGQWTGDHIHPDTRLDR